MFLIFDTYSGKKREFRPLDKKTVKIYTCGPSVYEYSHIGNFRTYLFEDILVRYLQYLGYRVLRVMNITDVEDKAIEKAEVEGISLIDLQKPKIERFFEEFEALGMLRPDIVAKASEHIKETVELIEKIEKK